MLIAATAVCGSPKGSSGRRYAEPQERDEGHPTSIAMDVVSAEETQVRRAGHVDECGTIRGDMEVCCSTWFQNKSRPKIAFILK